jgi:hypothetical protein
MVLVLRLHDVHVPMTSFLTAARRRTAEDRKTPDEGAADAVSNRGIAADSRSPNAVDRGNMTKTDPSVSAVVSDVVIRFSEHDQYGTVEKAVKALSRRLRSLSFQECTELFRFHRHLLAETIGAVKSAPKTHLGKYADIKDIDLPFLNTYLREAFPGHDDSILMTYVNWVIFWHYLK